MSQLDGIESSDYPMGILLLHNIDLSGVLSCNSFDLLRRLGRKFGFLVLNRIGSSYLLKNNYSLSSSYIDCDNLISIVDGNVVVRQHNKSFILSDIE